MNYIGKQLTLILAVMTFCTAIGYAQKVDLLIGGEEVVLQWNRVMFQTLAVPGQQPPTVFTGRTTAMVHLAMFDAVNSIDGTYNKYLTEVPGTKNASQEAAAAQAARDVLAALFPTREAIFDAELAMSLEGIEENRAKQGRDVGRTVAQNILAARANDGWTTPPPPYILPNTPGNWQPTPPANAPAAFTHFGVITPFALSGSGQFSPNPPPALTSAEYAADYNEEKSLGAVNSATRTAEQTLIAQIWASGPASTVTWNNVARNTAIASGNTTVENARLFALLHMTYHDALQSSFTSKYAYGLWRPVTAIRRGDEDGNPDTEPDPTWTPLIATPPYPTYAGNAASHGTSQAVILAQFYGRDDIPLSVSFPGPPATMRSYPGFAALANEQSRSRVYAGIHFNFDNTAGQSIGRNVANYIFANFLTRKCSAN